MTEAFLNMPPSYTLCDTPDQATAALAKLTYCTGFAFDSEGHNLGQGGGTLSLLSFKLPDGAIFLVDAIVLTEQQLQPFLDILHDQNIRKWVWDGRMDYSELWHGHNVELRGVLDLQLADVTSRKERGEGPVQQLNRLSRGGYLNRGSYANVHRLNALSFAVQEHGVEAEEDESDSKTANARCSVLTS